MKDFKFLKRNAQYNTDQRVMYAVCGSTTNHIAVINTTDVMSQVMNASIELRERIAMLEEETIRLRRDLNLVTNGDIT